LEDKFIDYDNKKVEKRNRPFAIIAEFIVVAFCITVVFVTYIFELSLAPLSIFYLFFGWYIFKGEKFTGYNTLISIIAGVTFFLISLGILGQTNSYSWGRKMNFIGMLMGLTLSIWLIVRYMKRKNEFLEYRFSLKLLSRVIFFTLISILVITY